MLRLDQAIASRARRFSFSKSAPPGVASSTAVLVLLVYLAVACPAALVGAEQDASVDWPTWRGSGGAGVAAEQSVPLSWSATENVLWKTDVAGRGNSSPIVQGDRIYLTTALEQEQVQSVLCFDRGTGKLLWKSDVHEGNFEKTLHEQCTHASCSVACSGKRVFALFMNNGAIWLTALDQEGKRLWQQKVCDFESEHGYGSSPAVHGSTVFVAVDNKGGNLLAAFDQQTGRQLWKTDRPTDTQNSFSTPVVSEVGGVPTILLSGCKLVAGYDPRSGQPLWSVAGAAQMTVGSAVTDGKLVFASGGYPERVTVCVSPAENRLVWSAKAATYAPSMLYHRGHLYGVANNGVAYCWEAATGKEMWTGRLGGNFWSSFVLVGGHLLISSEDGVTKVIKASADGLEVVSENRLPGTMMATPAVCGGRIFLRTAGALYCIGEK